VVVVIVLNVFAQNDIGMVDALAVIAQSTTKACADRDKAGGVALPQMVHPLSSLTVIAVPPGHSAE
jgi:type IV pilus biogenesis protein CpaD/CtpE